MVCIPMAADPGSKPIEWRQSILDRSQRLLAIPIPAHPGTKSIEGRCSRLVNLSSSASIPIVDELLVTSEPLYRSKVPSTLVTAFQVSTSLLQPPTSTLRSPNRPTKTFSPQAENVYLIFAV